MLSYMPLSLLSPLARVNGVYWLSRCSSIVGAEPYSYALTSSECATRCMCTSLIDEYCDTLSLSTGAASASFLARQTKIAMRIANKTKHRAPTTPARMGTRLDVVSDIGESLAALSPTTAFDCPGAAGVVLIDFEGAVSSLSRSLLDDGSVRSPTNVHSQRPA